MPTLYVIEEHDQLLHLWRSQNATNLKVAHLDFHCDMRGLLIDRSAQRAYPIRDIYKGLDIGNFLAHAILEGRVQRVRWIHDVPGGRRDDVGTVKYEHDLSVQLEKLSLVKRRQAGIPLDYEVMTFAEWSGLEAGEFLDIDWDVFACKVYPVNTIEKRIEAFLARNFTCVPEQISLCYSPGYSHSTRYEFEQFSKRLAGMFQAKIEYLPESPIKPIQRSIYQKVIRDPLVGMLRNFSHRSQLWLQQIGIY